MNASASDTPQVRRSAFAEPFFRRYFPASCFSSLGTWITRFLIGWSAWELTHSAFWVGVVSALMLLPIFVLSPLFGIVSDRINPRNGLLVTVGGQGVIAGLAGLGSYSGWFSLPWLLCLAVAVGAVTSAHTPIRLALIPRLVSRESLPSAIGSSAIIFNASRILGPAAGGWLIANASMALAFVLSMALFVGAFLILLTVRCRERSSCKEKASFFFELAAGIAYVRKHRGIKLILAFTLINGLVGRSVMELLPAISGQLLKGDANTLAILTATAGAGSIVGGFILSRQMGREQQLMNMVILSLLTGSLCLLPVHWISGVMGLAVMVGYLAMTSTVVGTGCQALAQLLVDEQYRGRVLSLWSVMAMGTPALGAFIMGAAADITGFPSVLLGFSLVSMLAVAVVYNKRHWLLQGAVQH